MKFKPMLSATLPVDFGQASCTFEITYSILGSYKLDGIRACVQNGKVVSRNLNLLPNKHVQRLFGRAELEGLDGELIVGDSRESDMVFRRTESAVMRRAGEPPVAFYVFDCFDQRLTFVRRLQLAERAMRKTRRALPHYPFDARRPNVVQSCLQLVQHVQLQNLNEVLKFESEALRLGYEGIMLRDPFGMYKQGRSTLREGGLFKLKRFKDGEAEIVGVEELLRNNNAQQRDALGRSKRSTHKANMVPMGMLGALRVVDRKTGAQFNIGSGFDEAERVELWRLYKFDGGRALRGRLVKYKFFPTGGKEKPRFPVFVGFRDARDM